MSPPGGGGGQTHRFEIFDMINQKIKSATELVLAMVIHASGAYSLSAGSALYNFSRKVRDGRFWPLEHTQKSRFFHKRLYRDKKHILDLNSMVIKTCLGVVWTYLRPLTNI